MKKKAGLMMLVGATLLNLLVSCGGEDTPTPPTVEFQTATKLVGEAAGIVDITVELDKAAPQTITVRYSLTGTAIEGTTSSADYKVVGKYGEVEIAQGAASGSIQLEIKQDLLVEVNETIIITIDEVVSNKAKIGTLSQTTVTIESDDVGAKVSFASATQTFDESDDLIEVQLVLDKAMTQDIIVSYAFNYDFNVPTAIDTVFAFNEDIPRQYRDFYVDGDYGELVIPQGETSGKIVLQLISDFLFEDDEMIEITITGVDGGGSVGTQAKTTLTITQEDGKVVALFWDEAYTDVDMDLFLWIGEIPGSTDINDYFGLAYSNFADFDGPEFLFIPAVYTDLSFGVSCNYYEGTEDPMNFEVQYIDFVAGAPEALEFRDVFTATYTAANVNPYFTSGIDPLIVQTFSKVGPDFVNFTQIMVPVANSRIKSNRLQKFELPIKGERYKFQKNF